MKYFLFLALVPCILAGEIQNAICIDGSQCPQGKYCCESGCCDITKEMQDKGYVPALPPSASTNESSLSMAQPESEPMKAPCYGTQCGNYCHPGKYSATCCNNPQFACPSNTRCCSNNYYQQPWCCKRYQRCSSVVNLCLNGAVTTSTAIMLVLLAFMIGMTSKYFL